ncbi:LysR family nod box-dependent transcriptional activator [Rhizobium mesoamericanum]|nr:LysR family nod box-dependent transcriptional activator [Rhizobium mesoamericanum]
MTERNLTAAARSINLSQPAMSAAVARLRTYFRDELFMMVGRELVPTPRAEGLAASVREALLHIQLSVISWQPFDPAQSERRFRVILSDYVTLVFIENVVERVAREAPGVSFEFMPIAEDFDELLQRGDVDFLIMPESFMSKHPHTGLFDDVFVCVACEGNDCIGESFSFDQYMSMGHVAVKFGCSLKPAVDDLYLRERGYSRRVEIVVQSFSMIPAMLSGTRRIGTMPLRLAQHCAQSTPLRILDLPLPIPKLTEAVQWPMLHDTDPASLWMRQTLLEEAARMAPSEQVYPALARQFVSLETTAARPALEGGAVRSLTTETASV